MRRAALSDALAWRTSVSYTHLDVYKRQGLPWAVLPVARKWLRDRVSHLVVSAKMEADSSAALRAALQQAKVEGRELVLALGGAGVLGDAAAALELSRLVALAETPEVTHLALDVSRLVPSTGSGAWSLDHDAAVGCLLYTSRCV